jgi:hypothetical protein
LTHIFNKSLSQGIFPERLKYAIVIPLFKKGDRTLLASYRSVSLLTGFSQLFEILIFQRLNQHFQVYQILIPQKYWFQHGISMDNASCKLTNSIFNTWNKKIYISSVLCDLERAFDNVYNELSLFKLEYYGTRGKFLDCLKFYFINRKKTVVLKSSYTHNFSSNWEVVKHRVPLVSVQDSLLFNMYINDFPVQINTIAEVIILADVTSTLVSW